MGTRTPHSLLNRRCCRCSWSTCCLYGTVLCLAAAPSICRFNMSAGQCCPVVLNLCFLRPTAVLPDCISLGASQGILTATRKKLARPDRNGLAPRVGHSLSLRTSVLLTGLVALTEASSDHQWPWQGRASAAPKGRWFGGVGCFLGDWYVVIVTCPLKPAKVGA
jgi:hypothetical protein